jgi:hypothetical protein
MEGGRRLAIRVGEISVAMKPVDNETFYREVDEELRREQMKTTWQRYGKWIVAAVILFLAAIAGYLYWQNRQQEQAGKRGEELSAVFEDIQAGKMKDAEPKLDSIAKEGGSGYRAAALLTKADLAIAENKVPAAVAAFKAVAEDEDFPAPYRELALIRQTAAEYDSLQPGVVIQRLQPLAVAGNPWFGSAGEMVALAYLKQQKNADAARIFAAMAKDQSIPASIRSRSVQMAGALGVDAVQQGETKESAR